MYAIVNTSTNQVVPQRGQAALTFTQLGRVDLPNGDVAFSCQAGQEWPGHKLYEVTINTSGSGTVISDADPVYNSIPQTVTIARTLSNPPSPTVIPYEDFQNRFTQAEQDATTEFVDGINLTNGNPKRPALKQAMMRVVAKGTVDLTEARTAQFCQALVAGGVITPQRKTEILTP